MRRYPLAVVALLAARVAVCESTPLHTWIHEGPRATFHVTADELATSGAGSVPNCVHTPLEYENFHLTFDYWLANWAGAQIIVRAPRDPLPASFDHLRVTIDGSIEQDLTKYVDLFDGASIAGWQGRGTGAWEVREGHITGADRDGIFYAPQEFLDFELTARCAAITASTAAFSCEAAHRARTADLNQVRSRIEADFEERWLMQITQGRSCRVRIDGRTVAETVQLAGKSDVSGQIGLQIHSVDSSVDFRDLRVYPLPS